MTFKKAANMVRLLPAPIRNTDTDVFQTEAIKAA